MHVDGARAEEQLVGDLAVRPSDRDETKDFVLASCQAAVFQLASGLAAETLVDLLADGLEIRGRSVCERTCSQLPERAVCAGEPLDAELAFAGFDQGDPGARLCQCALERRFDLR